MWDDTESQGWRDGVKRERRKSGLEFGVREQGRWCIERWMKSGDVEFGNKRLCTNVKIMQFKMRRKPLLCKTKYFDTESQGWRDGVKRERRKSGDCGIRKEEMVEFRKWEQGRIGLKKDESGDGRIWKERTEKCTISKEGSRNCRIQKMRTRKNWLNER